MPKETSSGVIIFRKEGEGRKYLLLHYPEGHWDFVKGKREAGESREETARREAEEETGIADLSLIPEFQETISWFFRRDNKTFYKEATFFLAETKQEKVKLSYEHSGFVWKTYEAAIEQATFKNAKALLKKAEAFLGKRGKQLRKDL